MADDHKERLARLEERTRHHEELLAQLRDDLKMVVRRLNQLLYTALTALLSGAVGLFTWLFKKTFGGP